MEKINSLISVDTGEQFTYSKKHFRKRYRKFYMGLAVLFAILVVFCAISNLIIKDQATSSYTGNALAQKPVFSVEALLDGTYFTQLEEYFTDQFAEHDIMLSIRQDILYTIPITDQNGVYIGGDGYLFTSPDETDGAAAATNADALEAYGENHPELSQSLIVVPAAANIMSARLPSGARVYDQLSDINKYTAELSAVQYLDAADVLSDHASDYIYYKTDPHWTSLGAFYVFSAYAQQLGASIGSEYKVHTVAEQWCGPLANEGMDYLTSDTVKVYENTSNSPAYTVDDGTYTTTSVYNVSALSTDDPYGVFQNCTNTQLTISTEADTSRTLLLVAGDDYADTFLQFLTPYYQTIYVVDPSCYTGNIDELIDYNGVTQVLYLYSADTFLHDTSLADMLNSSEQLLRADDGSYYSQEDAEAVESGKVIFLTFDDGPSAETERLLDILDKYPEVKVTFFTTSIYPEYSYLMKREADSGHTVAVHSYTHDYSLIYSSADAFWKDMQEQNEVVKQYTGSYTNIYRFPGGSSNTISENYCDGIMTELAKDMNDEGYSFVDWNITSGDAGDTEDTNEIIETIENGIANCETRAVILQHDTKDFSIDAVEPVIQWGLANGYVFQAITTTKFTCHHTIVN